MEKYTRSTFSSLRYLDENGGGKKIGRYFSRVSFTTCVSFSPLLEYTLVSFHVSVPQIESSRTTGCFIIYQRLPSAICKIIVTELGRGWCFEPTEETSSRFFPPPLPTPFTFPRKEPEIYILVPTCDSFQRIYFLFIVGKGRARKKADNSLNQKRKANAFLSLFLNIKETRDERRKVKFFGIF